MKSVTVPPQQQGHHILCKGDNHCPVCKKLSCSQELYSDPHLQDEYKAIEELEKELHDYILVKYRKEISITKMGAAVDAFIAILRPSKPDIVCIKCGTIVTSKGKRTFYLSEGRVK